MQLEVKSAPRSKNPRKRRKTTGEKLIIALEELAQGLGTIIHYNEQNWASITFAGTRHRLTINFRDEEAIEAGEEFIAQLPEHEFTIPGHLVADAAITQVDHSREPALLSVTCELLMLEEG